MKALVIGYGSAGQRHARILKEMGHEVAVSTRQKLPPGLMAFVACPDGWWPDYTVVASKTTEHYSDFRLACRRSSAVLIEKPLYDKPRPEIRDITIPIAVGYNLRFHPAVRALRKRIAGRELYTAQFHVGQWLPSWRPGRDYRATDVNGVLRDLSHEFDLMLWLCGWPTKLYALTGKATGLDIDCEDSASILCATERCPQTVITQNYIDHSPRRWIAINYDGGTILADLVNHTLTETRPDGATDTEQWHVDKDDTYTVMHRAMIDGEDADLLCSLDEGLNVVNLIALIESCKDVFYERAA